MSPNSDLRVPGIAGPQSRAALAILRPEGIKSFPVGLQNSLEALIAKAPYAMALLDANFCHLEVSDNYCEELRMDRVAILGRTHKELFFALPQSWDTAQHRCLAGESVKVEGYSRCADNGEQFRINYQLEPWRKSRTKIGGAILFSKENIDNREET